jgi:hypothetical protein
MHQFHKFILSWNSTWLWQFICPSSGVYSLYTQQWYMSYGFVESFRAGPGCPSSGVYSPYTQQWYISYGFVDSFQAGPSWSCSKAVYKPVWRIPLLSVQWINSWWWADELSKTWRVSWQNKCVKLVHLVGFITKKQKYAFGQLVHGFSTLTIYQWPGANWAVKRNIFWHKMLWLVYTCMNNKKSFAIWRYSICKDLKTEKHQELSFSKQAPKPIWPQLHTIWALYLS